MSELVTGIRGEQSPAAPVVATLERARVAAAGWAGTPIRERLAVIRRVRRAIAADPAALARSLGSAPSKAARPLAETLAAEVLPLVEAARFLEREASTVLRTRRLGRRGRPAWLIGAAAEIRREPCGAVLILAPGNYPLFLPGAQALQALAAGCVAAVKPAFGCAGPMQALAALLVRAGLPQGAFAVLDDSPATGAEATRAGFDRIVLTGSAETGKRVLAAAAETLTPCTMELSGNDPVFVLPGAELGRLADALAYGLCLNGGATCIAPRRVFVPAAMAQPLEQALLARLAAASPVPVPAPVLTRLTQMLHQAVAAGARVSAWPGATAMRPTVVGAARLPLDLLREDVFAPVLSLIAVGAEDDALALAAACPYALGASIFGPVAAARALAGRVAAGSVVINDLIVPTADPRLPFGGRNRSGFGLTRGAEGLLEMTVCKTVVLRRGRLRPHLNPNLATDADRVAPLITTLHAPLAARLAALRPLTRRALSTRACGGRGLG